MLKCQIPLSIQYRTFRSKVGPLSMPRWMAKHCHFLTNLRWTSLPDLARYRGQMIEISRARNSHLTKNTTTIWSNSFPIPHLIQSMYNNTKGSPGLHAVHRHVIQVDASWLSSGKDHWSVSLPSLTGASTDSTPWWLRKSLFSNQIRGPPTSHRPQWESRVCDNASDLYVF